MRPTLVAVPPPPAVARAGLPRVLVAAGTRPELLKLAPVVAALRATGAPVEVLRTGQHADLRMVGGTDDDPATTTWTLEGDEGARVGQLLHAGFDLFSRACPPPDVVVVQGDTYTAALVAMAARRFGIAVAHVEAGLRSGNPRSQEELHRRLLADLATVHLAPTPGAVRNLLAEGVPAADVHLVGNPVCDALVDAGVARVAPEHRRGFLLTAHRATNVDDPRRLAALVDVARGLASLGPVRFPVHPRTRDRLEGTGLLADLEAVEGLTMVQPLPHRALLAELAVSRVVVTDSGGLQEEASWFGVPVVVLRHSTPRPEGVELGQAVLVGLDPTAAVQAVRRLAKAKEQVRVAALPCPYGDGTAARRIAEVLVARHRAGSLPVDDPGGAA